MIVVASPHYLYGSAALNLMHPFAFDRASQVVTLLRSELGSELDTILREPEGPATLEQLSAVHDAIYLDQVMRSHVIAGIIEIPILGFYPRSMMRRWFVDPTLWGTAGTLLAARAAMSEGLGLNVSGGYHHAKRRWGEGFCLFSDIALAISTLRTEGSLAKDDGVFYVDLDVHQGNGVSTDFGKDPAVRIFDMFNSEIYPCEDLVAREGIDISRPLSPSTTDLRYLDILSAGLSELFEGQPRPRLVIYNAGTDIYKDDLLGGMKLSRETVNRRDQAVLETVRSQNIPLLVLASGGYSRASARLIADFALSAYRYEKERPKPK